MTTGNGLGSAAGLLALPSMLPAPTPGLGLSPSAITEDIRKAKDLRQSLRTRMEEDYTRYLLEWKDSRWSGELSQPIGQSTYISSEPRTFADRLVAILSSAKMNPRVPFGGNSGVRREFGQAKERFLIGVLRENDQRLLANMMPKLQPSLSFFIGVRGWYAGRAILIKRPDGPTTVDISPFDPLHTYYGQDGDGLAWVCHVTRRKTKDIENEFGPGSFIETPLRTVAGLDADPGVDVYDYYDREINCVVAGGEWLKPPEYHSPSTLKRKMVPCFVGPVGASPLILRDDSGSPSEGIAAQGESVYAGLRHLYDVLNQTLSDRLTLVRRSVRPGSVYKNPGGRKTISGDPFGEGSNLSIDNLDSFTPLELQSMVKDTDLLLAQIMGEIQRRSFSHISYGGVDFPLSGYAINSLSQGNELTLHHFLAALTSAYSQIGVILCNQYASGAYQPIKAVGQANRTYFQAEIDPRMVSQSDDILIEFIPKLPKDEPGAYAMAQIAREGERPLLTDRTILDEILKIQDVDAEEQLKLEQMGDRMAPPVLLMELIKSYQQRGETEKAMFYMQELQAMLLQPQLGAGSPAAGGEGQQQGVPPNMPGIRPQVRTPEAKVDQGLSDGLI